MERIEGSVCNDFILEIMIYDVSCFIVALLGSSGEECEMNVAVVIVVVLVIMAWFIGYIFLQKVEERKEKTKNLMNQRRQTFAIP